MHLHFEAQEILTDGVNYSHGLRRLQGLCLIRFVGTSVKILDIDKTPHMNALVSTRTTQTTTI